MNGISKIFVCSLLVSLCVVSPLFSAERVEQGKDSDVEVVSDRDKNIIKSVSIFCPTPSFEFDSAVDGADVLHDFVIMNKGTDILKVEKVKTG